MTLEGGITDMWIFNIHQMGKVAITTGLKNIKMLGSLEAEPFYTFLFRSAGTLSVEIATISSAYYQTFIHNTIQ